MDMWIFNVTILALMFASPAIFVYSDKKEIEYLNYLHYVDNVVSNQLQRFKHQELCEIRHSQLNRHHFVQENMNLIALTNLYAITKIAIKETKPSNIKEVNQRVLEYNKIINASQNSSDGTKMIMPKTMWKQAKTNKLLVKNIQQYETLE